MAVDVRCGLVFVDGCQQLHSTSLSSACLPCRDRLLSLQNLETGQLMQMKARLCLGFPWFCHGKTNGKTTLNTVLT